MVHKESSDWIQQPHDTKRSHFSGRGFLRGILIFTGKEINGFPPDSVPNGPLTLCLYLCLHWFAIWEYDSVTMAAYGQSTPGDKSITCGTFRSSLHNNCLRCLLHKPALHHSVFCHWKKDNTKKKKRVKWCNFYFHIWTRLNRATYERVLLMLMSRTGSFIFVKG